MSIVDDFAAIGGRLAEIEKTKTAADQPAPAATSTTSWMYTQPVEQAPVVWTPEHGYAAVQLNSVDLEFVAKREFSVSDIAILFVIMPDCA